MSTNKKDPVLVVLQLSGGNDYLNTVIPYDDPIYRDSRPSSPSRSRTSSPSPTRSACIPPWAPSRTSTIKGTWP